jgi:uncharacterized glyoxalase superfamily protein PhnB
MAETTLVLNLIDVVARDFDKTLAFYRALGVPIADLPTGGAIRHAEFDFANGCTLHLDNEELAKNFNAGWRKTGKGSRAIIGFKLESREAVDERYAALVAAGYEGRQAPFDAFWGARYAVVADPDGNDVGLMSPIDPKRRIGRVEPSP